MLKTAAQHRGKNIQRNIYSPGSQIHSYKRHDLLAVLFKNHCQDSLCIKSNASAAAPFPLLKILSFRIFHITQITVIQTVEKPIFNLLFFPLFNIIPYNIIRSGGSTNSNPNQRHTDMIHIEHQIKIHKDMNLQDSYFNISSCYEYP
jgi:hypothetical protein